MQLYAITDRKRLAPAAKEEAARRRELRGLIEEWISGGVDFIQLREKDLDLTELHSFAAEILEGLNRRRSKVLVNLPPLPAWLAALVAVADGVHIPGKLEPGSVERVRNVFHAAGRSVIVSASCHSLQEIRAALSEQVDFVVFAPVFEKRVPEDLVSVDQIGAETACKNRCPEERQPSREAPSLGDQVPGWGAMPGQGLGALRAACDAAEGMPVFALGGITVDNASACLAAGAAGVSGIRLFAGADWRRLRAARPIYS
jgi:thiamine-phosphate pyrophosphorylase